MTRPWLCRGALTSRGWLHSPWREDGAGVGRGGGNRAEAGPGVLGRLLHLSRDVTTTPSHAGRGGCHGTRGPQLGAAPGVRVTKRLPPAAGRRALNDSTESGRRGPGWGRWRRSLSFRRQERGRCPPDPSPEHCTPGRQAAGSRARQSGTRGKLQPAPPFTPSPDARLSLGPAVRRPPSGPAWLRGPLPSLRRPEPGGAAGKLCSACFPAIHARSRLCRSPRR